MKIFYNLLLVACILITQSACSADPSIDTFQLFILDESWYSMKLGYDAKQATPILMNADTSDSLFVISLDDIEQYDWDTQVITLTKEATEQLIIALGKATHGEEVNLTNMYADFGYGEELELLLYTKVFIVKVNDQPLYGGIFLNSISQMAIDYPVLRITMRDNRANIAILPVHIPFVMYDPMYSEDFTLPETETESDAFFTNLIQNTASSADAKSFRELIRDVRIRDLFKDVDKLR